jgi:DNA-binding response OmpR family regulator
MSTTALEIAEPVDSLPDELVEQARYYEELLERIRAVLRRVAPPDAVEVGPLTVDPRTRRVTLHGERIALAQKEYELLLVLAREPDRVFTKKELIRSIWGYPGDLRSRTLDSHASRLRRKLRAVDPETTMVSNVWGIGYRLVD